MSKFSKLLAVAMLVGGMAVTSCSSKQVAANEPVISGSTSTAAADTAPVESANLGGASSGQGR